MPPNLSEQELLIEAVRDYCMSHYGQRGVYFEIDLDNGQKVRIPIHPKRSDGEPANRHYNEFRSVYWNGISYTFSPLQAAVVKILWGAYCDGQFEVLQSQILTAIGSQSPRLADLYRRNNVAHAAWNEMIVQGELEGSYRLSTTRGTVEA